MDLNFSLALKEGHYACVGVAKVKACLPAASLVWLDGNEGEAHGDTSFGSHPTVTHSCGSLWVYNRKTLSDVLGSRKQPLNSPRAVTVWEAFCVITCVCVCRSTVWLYVCVYLYCLIVCICGQGDLQSPYMLSFISFPHVPDMWPWTNGEQNHTTNNA